jgi:hypothetical protein
LGGEFALIASNLQEKATEALNKHTPRSKKKVSRAPLDIRKCKVDSNNLRRDTNVQFSEKTNWLKTLNFSKLYEKIIYIESTEPLFKPRAF